MSINKETIDENEYNDIPEYDEIQEYLEENDLGSYDVTDDSAIDQDDSSHIAYEASSLGIHQEELAEIGGFSIQFAREVLDSHDVLFPAHVVVAMELIESDFEKNVDLLSKFDELPLYSTNADLRSSLDIWPARGKSGGGFVGIHRKAVYKAHQISGAPIINITD